MDWLFRTPEGVCHARAAGVLVKDGRLLAQRDGREYALPGGHVKFGETMEETLLREYREEMGLAVTCQRLLWTEECFWTWNGAKAHNLSYYFLLDSSVAVSDEWLPLRDHPSVAYGWLPLEQLETVAIYPAFLKEEIHKLSDSPKHFISRA